MPQGGGATTAPRAGEDTASSSSQLFQLIREGVSWSGNERNNCFLNIGGDHGFCDISSATAFDFADDGRAMVLTDWDADGDLDAITSNRNAPQVRFLRNDIPRNGNQSLGIQLVGTGRVNRDAIGARVTVYLPDQPPLIRTLRAGEGFQAQNSKWLHFGLGAASEIARVTVAWPGGEEATYAGLEANARYRLTFGQQQPERLPERNMKWAEPLPELKLPESESGGQSVTASRLPVADLPYVTLDGKDASLKPTQLKGPMLINLWASWCKPCLLELKDFSKEQASIQKAGLQVFALSLDGVAGQPGSPQAARGFMKTIGDPFPIGIATPEALEKITILHNLIFEKRGSVSLPTSLLVDQEGRLVSYHEGPLTTDELLKQISTAQPGNADVLMNKALPFDGRWLAKPFGFRLTEYGNALLKQGYEHDAAALVNDNFNAWKRDPSLLPFLLRLGQVLEEKGDLAAAVKHYSQAVDLKPDSAMGHSNLGVKYSALGQYAKAEVAYRAALAIDATLVNTRYNLGIALSKQRKSDNALKEFSKVVKRAPEHVLAHANIAAQMMQRKELPTAIKHLRLALKAKPDFHAVRFQLGRLLEAIGKPQEAIAEYKDLLQRAPKYTPAIQRLKTLEKQAP